VADSERRRQIEPRRGEVWWGEIEDIGRRPFLVMTRSAAIPVLHNLLAAPITRTVRGIPTEVRLGVDDAMPTDCAASFDNLRVVPKSYLKPVPTTDGSPWQADKRQGVSVWAWVYPPASAWRVNSSPLALARLL